jgi:S1-C subfamily serine protease
LTSVPVPVDDPASPSADHWQARIVDADGMVRGSGVLISDRHVLTCAHVLASGTEPPTARFTIDFPRSPSRTRVTARVLADGWFPELITGEQDVAILELTTGIAADIVPARLGRAQRSMGRPVKVYGHPDGLPEGVWARAEITDTTGPYGERVQVSVRGMDSGDRIEPGFSGGGVIDEASALVVGIIVTTFTSKNRAAAWMIPTEVIALYWRHVFGMIDDPGDPEPPLGAAALDDLTDVLSRFASVAGPAGREQVADRLPAAPRARLSHSHGSVRDLVQACRQPSELRALADLIRYFEGESAWENRLEEVLESFGILGAETSTEEPDQLTEASRRDLRDALIRQPYFREAETRHLYLDAFRRRVWTTRNIDLRVQKSLNAAADAAALIELCRPIPGSLRMLVDDFPYGDSSRAEFGPLLLLIESLCTHRLLTDGERGALLRLVQDVPPTVLQHAYRRAAPRLAGGDAVPAEPALLIRQIEGQSQPPGALPRILQFVEHLATRATDLAEPLRVWSDRTAARLHLRHAAVDQLREQLAQAPAEVEPPVLVVQLAPDALRPADRFLLSAVLERDGHARHVLVLSDEPEGIDAIRARVDGLFDEVYAALDFQPELLTVEVFVPRVLLTEAVDRWDVTEVFPVPLGEKFGVVLRSYDRLRQTRLWPQWGHKWRLAREQDEWGTNAMHYVGPDDRSAPEQIFEALRPEDKLALVLGRRPAAQPDLRPYDAFVAALQAGVPYVVWVREVSLADDFLHAMQRLLAAEPVRNVPRRIAEWRSPHGSHAGSGAGLGEHVSVVACDFDRRTQFAARELRPPPRRRQP